MRYLKTDWDIQSILFNNLAEFITCLLENDHLMLKVTKVPHNVGSKVKT